MNQIMIKGKNTYRKDKNRNQCKEQVRQQLSMKFFRGKVSDLHLDMV